MFEYMDRLIRIARPRRLLYLAVGSSIWLLLPLLMSSFVSNPHVPLLT